MCIIISLLNISKVGFYIQDVVPMADLLVVSYVQLLLVLAVMLGERDFQKVCSPSPIDLYGATFLYAAYFHDIARQYHYSLDKLWASLV